MIETMLRIMRIAVACASVAYFGLVLALAMLTSFRLGAVWAVMCALMVLLSVAALLIELDELRGVSASSTRKRQPV